MSRAKYNVMICNLAAEAVVPEFRQVSLPGWNPEPSCCHANVDHWVKAVGGQSPIRGWIFYHSYAFPTGEAGQIFTAHSIVRDIDGTLYDITPIGGLQNRPSLEFVTHPGTDDEFFDLESQDRCIRCPGPAYSAFPDDSLTDSLVREEDDFD